MRRNPWALTAAIALVLATFAVVLYSYTTSSKIDRSAAQTGSSTEGSAPNTLQDRGWGRAPEGGRGTTNVPPAAPQAPR
jgi:hypothetical protein